MNNFNFKDLLFFNKLVMPSVLTFIYWVAAVFIIISGIFTMISVSFFGGIIAIVVGLISIRISFELICVVFSINRNLEKLVALQSNQAKEQESKSTFVDNE